MDVLTFYLDDTAPVIKRRLSLQSGGDYDIVPGIAFRLRVRPLWGENLVIDGVMTVDVDTDEITYSLQPGDLDVEGIYRAWIFIDFGSGSVQNTDEFQINVLVHGPGQGTQIGAVYRAARALEPVAWDALRHYPDYGDPELQRSIELAKLRVLGVSVPVADEESIDIRVVDYIAKKVLVDNVLYAAISFWTNQVVQQSARGNSEEVVTYPDRVRAAQDAIKLYREDLERQAGELSTSSAYDAPALLDSGELLTPGLDEYRPLPVATPRYDWWWGAR